MGTDPPLLFKKCELNFLFKKMLILLMEGKFSPKASFFCIQKKLITLFPDSEFFSNLLDSLNTTLVTISILTSVAGIFDQFS